MGADRRPLIVIGAPVYGTVRPELLEDWMRFAYHLGRRMPAYDFATAIRTKTEQFRARNSIVEAAMQANADYLLMIDDDMIINAFTTTGPTEEYDFLATLLAHDKDICGVLYYQRTGACLPVLMSQVAGGGYRFLHDDEITHGLQRVDVAGGGCLLIKMQVFHHLRPPFFAAEVEYGTDMQLCRAAAAKGFEVWADTSIEFGHIREEQTVVTSRNRHQFVFHDGVPGEVHKRFVAADVYNRLLDDVAVYSERDTFAQLLAEVDAQSFLDQKAASGLSDADWYRTFPLERVARQVWFNVQNATKKAMTEFILMSVDHSQPYDVLDFGCGIGIPAFTFADRGHRVTACDIQGTGTLEFLKWRVKRHGLDLRIHETRGGVPHLGGAQYDVIVAMDTLEHIPEWRTVLRELASRLRPNGVLFCNNGVLNDNGHPEHYPLANKDFIAACLDNDLLPTNQITFTKRNLAEPAGAGMLLKEPAHA